MSPSQAEKVKTGFWSLSQDKVSKIFFYLLILFLPTQLGKHFWPNFSFVFGLRLDYLSPTFYFTDFLILAIFIFSLGSFLKSLIKIKTVSLILFIVFLISLIGGILFSKNYSAGWYGFIKLIEFSFLAFYVKNNFNLFKKEIIFACFLAGIVFEASLSLFQFFNGGSLNSFLYFLGERTFTSQTPGIANASINGQLVLRPYGTFSHPNVLAGYLIIAMLYLLLFFSKKIKRFFLFLGIVFGTASLLLTFGRMAIFLWTAYLVLLFRFLIPEKYKKELSNLRIVLFLSIFIFLFLFIFFFFQNSVFFQRFLSTKLSDEPVIQRQELISESLIMFAKNPVFGVGLNNFFYNINYLSLEKKTMLIQPVHNIFLYTLSQTGLTGIFFLTYILFRSFKNILKKASSKEKAYLLMGLFSVIFLGMFDHYFLTIQQGQILLTLIIGISLSYKKN